MHDTYKIKLIDLDELRAVLTLYRPRGLFLCREGKWWIAVDNTTGEAWTEEFLWKWHALCWLCDN